jgi:hypothetical protein
MTIRGVELSAAGGTTIAGHGPREGAVPLARDPMPDQGDGQMFIGAIVLGCWFLGWLIINLPRKRSDGVLVKGGHPYRQVIPFLMTGRNESIVFYDDQADASKLVDYVARARVAFDTDVDITHCLVAALARALADHPQINRFVAGKRLYQRDGATVTFSMKRKRLDRAAKLATVKLHFSGDESFEAICRLINGRVDVERSDTRTYTDRELGLLSRLPRPVLGLGLRVLRWLDYHNLAPASFIEQDGFYASAFIANLGSLGMKAGYHHLYEYGTCPLFMMVGRIEERPMVVAGQVVPRLVCPIRWSFDERIDDGLTAKGALDAIRDCLENPEAHFGRLDEQSTPGSCRSAA